MKVNFFYICFFTVRLGIKGGTACTSSHEGRQIISVTLPIHIDQLFTLLFTNSKFFLDFQTARKTTGKYLYFYL